MSNTQSVSLLCGNEQVSLDLPASATVLTGKHIPTITEPHVAVREALDNPVGCPSLRDQLASKQPKTVAITISDITRPVPNKVIVPPILDRLNEAGIRDEDIVIIIGTGMHRPSTAEERDILLGREILGRIQVIDHDAEASETLVKVSDDPPVSVNGRFVNADFRIVTGLIEPHFMAGYSGGRKGICPALVDLNTVQRFHGFQVLSDSRSDLGVLAGNPCHQESLRVAKIVGMDLLLNVSITHDRQLAGVYCGDMEQAHLVGCKEVGDWNSADVSEPFDLVVTCGGGFPLDQTFYQTVKGIVGVIPAIHESSDVLIVSSCAEGIGSPEYTQVMLKWQGDWQGFLDHIQSTDAVTKDQWQYQMHARTLAKVGVDRLHLASDGLPIDTQCKLGVRPVDGDGTAGERAHRFVESYLRQCPEARVAVVPTGPYTMIRNP